MNKPEQTTWVEALVRLVCGTGAMLIVGYIQIGRRTFELGPMDSPFLSIGIAGSLVFIIYKLWGTRSAAAATVLLSMGNAALAQRQYVTVWSETFGMLLMLILLCHALTALKVERPVIGRLLLLGPLFSLVGWLLTFGFRLFSAGAYREYMFEASKNNAIHNFVMGVGLGLGLELAELAIRLWRHRSVPVAEAKM